jgi:hypothetical protein
VYAGTVEGRAIGTISSEGEYVAELLVMAGGRMLKLAIDIRVYKDHRVSYQLHEENG